MVYRDRVVVCVLVAALLIISGVVAQPPQTPVASSADENKELIAAALKLTKEAAGKYEFALEGAEEPAPRLVGEPVLRWSNPSVGEVHGNVFLWTSGGRPAVVGSIFKWFSPHTHMSHEFHSLAEQPLTGKFDGKEVWVCSEPDVRFAALAGAPQPAEGKLQRLLRPWFPAILST